MKEDNTYPPDASKLERLSSRAAYRTRLYLTSGGKEYVADGSGRNSPFAAQILRVLRNPDRLGGLVTSSDLWDVAQNVVREGQHPEFDSFGSHEVTADFWLVERGTMLAKVTAPAVAAGLKRGDDSAPAAPPAPAPANLTPTLRAGQTKLNPKDGLRYVWIPPGTFQMGCSQDDSHCRAEESPAHQVTITKGFYMGQTPVTQAAYQRVMGTNPSNHKGDDSLPVETVSWNDARDYCGKAGMRLPTEAEWEYAARAGSTAAQYGPLDAIAWYNANSASKTHPVGQKQENAWGLNDMLGNVWQWTADWYGEKYYQPGASTDPTGPPSGTQRAARGGSWSYSPLGVRVSSRYRYEPENRNFSIGVRCAGE